MAGSTKQFHIVQNQNTDKRQLEWETSLQIVKNMCTFYLKLTRGDCYFPVQLSDEMLPSVGVSNNNK